MARLFQFLVFLFYRGVESLLIVLPLTLCGLLGSLVGGVGWWLSPHYRALVVRNLTIAFGDNATPADVRRLGRKHFRALGRNLFTSMRLGRMRASAIRKRVRYENQEALAEVIREGKGVITAIAHLGPWELLSLVDSKVEITRGTMYQPLANPFLNRHIVETRAQDGTVLFDRRKGFYNPMKHLRDGNGLGILVDQNAGDHGVWCPLFGRLASTTNLASLLSIRTGAPVIPMGVSPDGFGKWTVHFGDPIRPVDEAGNAVSSARLTARMNLALEEMILRRPEEWFWVHNRWKTPLPECLLTGYKRGIEYPEGFTREDLKPFRILVRSPNWLGDACMAVPAVRAIRKGRPDAHVTVLCREGLADLWLAVRHVDEVITIPKKASPWKVRRLLAHQRPFDIGILLTNSLRTALEMKVGAVPLVVGYAGHGRRWLLDHVIPEPQLIGPPEHHAERYMRIAAHLGADVTDPELHATPAHPPGISNGKLKIGLSPGAAFGPAKQYPLNQLAEAIDLVHNQLEGLAEWNIYGGPGDFEAAAELQANCQTPLTNLAGQTSLAELVDEIRSCQLIITNDSGAMHLAALTGVPTVAIFGSTEPALTGPMEAQRHRVLRHHVECSPCFQRRCPLDFRCMRAIRPQEVAQAALSLAGIIKSRGPGAKLQAPAAEGTVSVQTL